MKKSDQFWDKTAKKYAKAAISDEESYQKKLSETQHYFSPDMHVVEFGCGTGSTAIVHSPYVQHINAIDVSENMLEIGREKAKKAGVENISFSRGTLFDLNIDSASVDVVLGLNVIHLIADRQSIIEEVARILKPGGVFVSSTACLGNSYLRFIKWLVPLGKLLGLMPDVFVFTAEELMSEVKEANFSIDAHWRHGMQDTSVFMVARKRL